MQKIQNVLPVVLARRGLERSAVAAQVGEIFRQFFAQHFGTESLPQISKIKFLHSKLVVHLKCSVFSSEVFKLKEEFLEHCTSKSPVKVLDLILKVS